MHGPGWSLGQGHPVPKVGWCREYFAILLFCLHFGITFSSINSVSNFHRFGIDLSSIAHNLRKHKSIRYRTWRTLMFAQPSCVLCRQLNFVFSEKWYFHVIHFLSGRICCMDFQRSLALRLLSFWSPLQSVPYFFAMIWVFGHVFNQLLTNMAPNIWSSCWFNCLTLFRKESIRWSLRCFRLHFEHHFGRFGLPGLKLFAVLSSVVVNCCFSLVQKHIKVL